jgi:endonuclease YncB( thermonuclease family)
MLNEQLWDCYSVSFREMQILVAEGPVSCTKVSADLYRRPIATCEVGGRDLGLAMVEAGMAFAFRLETDTYVAAEETAEAAEVGLWRSEFTYPWEFRAMWEGNIKER